MSECPKCGGDTGFNCKIIVTYLQWKSWDNKLILSEDSQSSYDNKANKMGECLDCGYRFRLSRFKKEK